LTAKITFDEVCVRCGVHETRFRVQAPRLRGRLCDPCYQWLDAAMGRALAPKIVPPCALCGTREGRRKGPDRPPIRVDGASVGIRGKLCARCHLRLYKRLAKRAGSNP